MLGVYVQWLSLMVLYRLFTAFLWNSLCHAQGIDRHGLHRICSRTLDYFRRDSVFLVDP